METNVECRLPCWWGVLPGKTSWQNAEKYLSSITTSIYESAGATPDTRRIEMLFPAPYPFDGEFRKTFQVDAHCKRAESSPTLAYFDWNLYTILTRVGHGPCERHSGRTDG